MVDAVAEAIRCCPEHFLVLVELDQLDRNPARAVGRLHNIAIGEQLRAATVLEGGTREVIVGDLPDLFATLVEFDIDVAIRTRHQRIAILHPQRTKCPVWRLRLPDNAAIRRKLAHTGIKQIRHQVVAIRELTRHPRLHMVIASLCLQSNLNLHLAAWRNLEQPWIRTRLNKQRIAIRAALARVHLRLRALVLPDNLVALGIHFHHTATWPAILTRDRKQIVAIR